jgi:hypothetical protein
MTIEVHQKSVSGWCVSERHGFSKKFLIPLLLLALASGSPRNQAQAQALDEYQVKAALLFNFIKFVDWPAEAFSDGGAPIVIGVVGDDPFGSALDEAISGKSIHGRPLAARRLRWGQDLRACHILFISASERKRLPQIIASLRGASVLTLSDIGQFNQQGGIISFILEASKVRFEINAGVAEQARLKISAKLLALAKSVKN